MTDEIKKKRDESFVKLFSDTFEEASPGSKELLQLFHIAGFDAGFAIQQERIGILRTAIRQALGWFALWNDEKDQEKWPKYIKTCEQALDEDDKLARGEKLSDKVK